MCTHFLVFLHEENEIADVCTNFIVFLQEENEIYFETHQFDTEISDIVSKMPSKGTFFLAT